MKTYESAIMIVEHSSNIFTRRRLRAPSVVASVALVLAACSIMPKYDSPPLMPVVISPAAGERFESGSVIEFAWHPSAQTELYDFHIFNANNSDIDRYMKRDLKPQSICQAEQCRLQLAVELPGSDRHAWRVRSVNVAGRSSWTRTIFGIAGGEAVQ